MANKIRVAIVGLGFGAEFIPIFQQHPDAEMYAVCRRDKAGLDATAKKFGIPKAYSDFNELLADKNVDAVHINSPIAEHAPQSIAALKAGKHGACTVPMATSVEDCRTIVDLQKKTGKIYNSPFAIETATFKIKDTDIAAEVTRSLFDTARQYRESFDVTGSRASFEWQQVEGEQPVIHFKGLPEAEIPKRVKVPDYAGRLPDPIRKFTGAIHDATHPSFVQGGGHRGNHPHLAHNFLQACLGKQAALPDAPTSANWTMVGICAHQSALKVGERVHIPTF